MTRRLSPRLAWLPLSILAWVLIAFPAAVLIGGGNG